MMKKLYFIALVGLFSWSAFAEEAVNPDANQPGSIPAPIVQNAADINVILGPIDTGFSIANGAWDLFNAGLTSIETSLSIVKKFIPSL